MDETRSSKESEQTPEILDENDSNLSNKKKDDEHKRLGGYAPLTTIARLCPGPLISQFTSAMYGLVNSMWVTKFIGELGLTAMSESYVIENTILAFGYFVSTSASTKISYLFSRERYDSANQVVPDIIRVCLIIGICLPAIFLPSTKPIVRWLGAEEDVVDLSFYYLLPLLACSFTGSLFLCSCGILQAEGRTWVYGAAQVISLVLNMACLDPLLLHFIGKVWAASMSTAIAEAAPGLVLLTLIYLHKFTIAPKCNGFVKKFDHATYSALGTGFSALIMNLSVTIPSIFLQKFIGIAANNIGEYNTVMALWNANTRLYQLTLCVPMALNAAYLPAASYAFGRNNHKRILKLTAHVSWISVVWGAIVTFVVCAFPDTIAKIWSSEERFLYWSKKILPLCFYTIILCSLKYILISFLQATQRNLLAVITAVGTELLPLPCFAAIFHYTSDKTDPSHIFLSYVCNDCFSIVMCLVASGPSLYRFYKLAKEETEEFPNDDEEAIIPEL